MPAERNLNLMGERLELLIAERDIHARIAALARDIDADYRGKRLSLIVVLKGAVIFAADARRQASTMTNSSIR